MYKSYVKRWIDIFVSVLTLIILSPVLIIVAVLIKIQDGGSILFIQDRIGQNAKVFKILKFRSMPVNTANVDSSQTDKIQITTLGKIIRRTNIDELPQLLNILKGDMSLIGPRPCITSQVKLIQMRLQKGVYNCKPGLTGLAQVNSFDKMPDVIKVDFDMKYADNITFGGDLKIILKTFTYLTKKPPTY